MVANLKANLCPVHETWEMKIADGEHQIGISINTIKLVAKDEDLLSQDDEIDDRIKNLD